MIIFPFNRFMQNKKGFTMVELLIVLAILGVIAVFAIPKLVTAQSNHQCRAVLKETISMLQGLAYQDVVLSDTITWSGTGYNGNVILDQVNAVKICNGNSNMLGCWDLAAGTFGGSSNRGFVLPNGAVVVGQGLNPNTNFTHIFIDCNGTQGPNTVSQDQIGLDACYSKAGCSFYADQFPAKAGTLIPNPFTQPDNINSTPFYNSIFDQ